MGIILLNVGMKTHQRMGRKERKLIWCKNEEVGMNKIQ